MTERSDAPKTPLELAQDILAICGDEERIEADLAREVVRLSVLLSNTPASRDAVLEGVWRAVARLNVDTPEEQAVIQRAVDAVCALKNADPQEAPAVESASRQAPSLSSNPGTVGRSDFRPTKDDVQPVRDSACQPAESAPSAQRCVGVPIKYRATLIFDHETRVVSGEFLLDERPLPSKED